MRPSRRLVLIDPGCASAVGHHADLNGLLLPALRQAGWAVELWADAAADPALAADLPGLRPLLRDAGYIDPRHWCDLPGTLHQASLLQPQLQQACTGDPVAVWLAHSLLPFQLIALARLLQGQPPATVLISLMFAPGEVFGGQPELELGAQRQAAELQSRSALAALAVASQRAGHRLQLAAASQQLIASYTPLCAAVGLPPPALHPAPVVGPSPGQAGADGPVLLHWGERKPDKGRDLALALLERLLEPAPLPAALQPLQWCFHAASSTPAPAAEAALLARVEAHPALQRLEGPVPRARMLAQLASAPLALLPYCPQAYAERSSGVLWLYGAARAAQGRPARVLGHPGGWLAAEASALGLAWTALPPEPTPAQLLTAVADALQAVPPAPALSAYGRTVLLADFATWLVDRLAADNL